MQTKIRLKVVKENKTCFTCEPEDNTVLKGNIYVSKHLVGSSSHITVIIDNEEELPA